MRKTFTMTFSLAATVLLSAQAFAQTEPAPAAEAAPAAEVTPAEPAPVEEVPATEPPAAEAQIAIDSSADVAQADTTAETYPMADPVEEAADEPVAGWFRVDHDGLGLQLWFGGTHNIGGVDIASDIYVLSDTQSAFGEFDIGPVFALGDLTLTPMIGIGFDWKQKRTTSLIAPQLFTIFASGDIYVENWIQGFMNSPFTDGANDDLYIRLFALYQVIPDMAIGPQIEATIGLNTAGGSRDSGELSSLPVGGRINLNYGENNTLGLFLGVETNDNGKAQPNDRSVAGRFTFVRTW